MRSKYSNFDMNTVQFSFFCDEKFSPQFWGIAKNSFLREVITFANGIHKHHENCFFFPSFFREFWNWGTCDLGNPVPVTQLPHLPV